jgi:hypothetical protein
MSFSFKSVYRLVSPAAQIGVKQFTLCLKGAHPGTGEFGAGASLALQSLRPFTASIGRVSAARVGPVTPAKCRPPADNGSVSPLLPLC